MYFVLYNKLYYFFFLQVFFIDVFPLHQKRFWKKINQAFYIFLRKDVLHAFDEKRKILSEKFPIGQNIENFNISLEPTLSWGWQYRKIVP